VRAGLERPVPAPAAPARSHPRLLVAAALGTVYLVWGSTYLGIRIAIETLPPFLMASVRFLIAGVLLYSYAIRRGDRVGDKPGRAQWLGALIVGGALLAGGNGVVSWGEQYVASGLAALLLATIPLWMVLFARLMFGDRLRWPAKVGVAVGFVGLVLLVSPTGGGLHLDPIPTAIVLAAAMTWAWASVYSRKATLPSRPLVSTGMQMLCGAAVLAVAGIATGELGRVDLSGVSVRSALALAYLIVFGSLLAFTTYVWLLQNVRTSLVATYAYVNPVVAVLLGWAVLAEPVSLRSLVAGAVIVVGVALIVTARKPAAKPNPCTPDDTLV
jgi:drug/metabolite transporter (DMT)-like permease